MDTTTKFWSKYHTSPAMRFAIRVYDGGDVVSATTYTAFGEVRKETGTSPTDYTESKRSFGFKVKTVTVFTRTHGQRSYMDELGLMYYVARWYDPSLNQFIQPDSLIPQPGNSADWDRYAYVLWNPVRYSDPSGHVLEIPNDNIPLIDGDPILQEYILNTPTNRGSASSTFSPDDQYDLLYNASYHLRDAENYLMKQGINECGVAALAMVMNYMAQNNSFVTIDDLAAPMTLSLARLPLNIPIWKFGDTKGATFPWGVAAFYNLYSAYSEQISGIAHFSYNNSIDDVINRLNETRNPVTVVLNMQESLHYVNVVGYDPYNIFVMDPADDTEISRYSRTVFNQDFAKPFGLHGMMISYRELWWEK
ncbi:MAG: C39 family peptidase [Anaerolineae bacterium]|nr:C39 family peptidase [Anaerolineae bacterium]